MLPAIQCSKDCNKKIHPDGAAISRLLRHIYYSNMENTSSILYIRNRDGHMHFFLSRHTWQVYHILTSHIYHQKQKYQFRWYNLKEVFPYNICIF